MTAGFHAVDDAVGRSFDVLRDRVQMRLSEPQTLAWLFRVPAATWAPDYLTFGGIGRTGVERFLNRTLSGLAPDLWHRTLWAKIRRRVMDYGATTYFPRILKDVPKTPEVEALRRHTLAAMNGLLLRNWPELTACTFYEAFDCLAAIMNEARRAAGFTADSFAPDRARQNAAGLAALPAATALVEAGGDRLSMLLRLACRANWIDGMEDGVEAVEAAVVGEVAAAAAGGRLWLARDDGPTWRIAACRAVLDGPPRSILYELDNSGEAVFDLLLAAELLRRGHRVTLGEERPVANDITRDELTALLAEPAFAALRQAEADGRLAVVTAGPFAAARLLNAASAEYRRAYAAAELLLLKGQGNFQTTPFGSRRGGRFTAFPYRKPIMVLMGVKADLARMALATIHAAPPALGEPYAVWFDPADPTTWPA